MPGVFLRTKRAFLVGLGHKIFLVLGTTHGMRTPYLLDFMLDSLTCPVEFAI